jgi:hypothetical protein
MDPIEYTLSLQRFLIVTTGVSFISLVLVLVWIDPTTNPTLYLPAFLVLIFVFLACIMTLMSFWWVFSIQRKVLIIPEVNKIVYQAIMSSAVVVFFLVLSQTGELNALTSSAIILSYLLYQVWLRSEKIGG